MSNYICVISPQTLDDGKDISADAIYRELMSKNVWGLHPRTAQRAKVVKGDNLVFYVAGVEQHFVGTAVASSSTYFDEKNKELFYDESTMQMDIEQINIFDTPKPIKPLLNKLSFIKNPQHWGPYLMGGVRKLNNTDFQTIVTSEDYRRDFVEEKLGIKHFVESINFDEMVFRPHNLNSPDRINISKIIENVETRWAIPNFQRYFDWNREDVRALLESIFNDYYVGAFLLWEASERSPLSLIEIEGSSNNLRNIEYIILDGQQRCTALYYAIKSPDFALRGTSKNSYYYIDFKNFVQEQNSERVIVVQDREIAELESFENLMFPVNRLSESHVWIDALEDYLYKYETEIPREKIRDLKRLIEGRLRHMWAGFEIPYVVLPKTMDLSQVSIIFEKINTKGKQLSTFDLLIAKLLRNEVDLRKLWEGTEATKARINQYSKKSERVKIYIFQSLSLRHHPASSAKKKDILTIYETLSPASASEFNEAWFGTTDKLEDALSLLENLRSGYGVLNEDEVPFSPMIPVLSALMTDAESRPNRPDCHNKISQWYWSAIFTNAYSSAAETQMTVDYREVHTWFDDDTKIPKVVTQARNNLASLNLREVNNHSNAIYKGVLSLVALSGAVDFETLMSLEMARANEKDHIFPKAKSSGLGDHPCINSVLNMTWLSDSTNVRKTNKLPSKYIPEFISEKYAGNELKFDEVLESHLISERAKEALLADDFDSFLDEREKNIIRVIRNRIGLDADTEEVLEESPETAVDALEEGLRDLINEKLVAGVGENYWKTNVSGGIKERVKMKLEQRIKRHPSENHSGLSGREMLDYCDIMDYHEIATANNNWPHFEKVFGSRDELKKHFLQLKEYRNAVKHGRDMNNVERKQGEASYEWFDLILKAQK